MPVTFLFFILFTGLLLNWFTEKWKKTGKILLTTGILVFFLICFPPVSAFFVQSLERTYPALDHGKAPVEYIWVLGSGSADDMSIPLHSRIKEDGLYRVLEGVRLHQQFPEAKIVFSGGTTGMSKPVSEVAADIAESLGVPRKKMIIVPSPIDTWDEAVAAKKIIRNQPFLLVTSAIHMKRSVYCFNKNGLFPTPAPCGHYIKKRRRIHFYYFIPSARSAYMMRLYLHEKIGLFWLKILNRIGRTEHA